MRDEDFVGSADSEAARVMAVSPDAILDMGCGVGRLPIGLARAGYTGSYTGIDVSQTSIRWCQQHLRQRQFRFVHVNASNERYNPSGETAGRLPFNTAAFDFAYLYSVFSHMLERDVVAYANELGRVVEPGGTLFLTAFAETGVPTVAVNPKGYRREWVGALHCVRYERAHLLGILDASRFDLVADDYAAETDGQTAFTFRHQ